jgi:F0F1-type ATP synthase assembly protein I
MSKRGGWGKSAPLYGRGLSLAFEFVGAVFLFWFIGRLIDGWLDIEPWAQVVGAVVGWVGGTLHVYYAVQRGRR